MTIEINEFIEFSETRADHVTLIGIVNHYPQDGTFCEDVIWDEGHYSDEENKHIACIAFSNSMYCRFFEKFEKENKENLIESNI